MPTPPPLFALPPVIFSPFNATVSPDVRFTWNTPVTSPPLPPITVPSVTLDGDKDGVLPASDGSASASKFTGRRIHRVVPGAGHNVPQEAPEAFAAAVMELVRT